MTIPEAQLETWAKQGSVTQSSTTYASVRLALTNSAAVYANRQYDVFLQGSYGNATNIYADSDVDVVIRLDDVFYHNLATMPADDQAAFDACFSDGTYGYDTFKSEVTLRLQKAFGAATVPGKKAIVVNGDSSRRKADVLPAAAYRRYGHFSGHNDHSYAEGICFWLADGTQIINYPKQHSENCTTKHQATDGRFKPTVRILKNLRNRMIAGGVITGGLAPSYFLEGMLYNVPNNEFTGNHSITIPFVLNWLLECDTTQLVCANEEYYLLRESSPVTWRKAQFDTFLSAACSTWNGW